MEPRGSCGRPTQVIKHAQGERTKLTNRKIIFCFASSLVLAASLPAQVTHGQPPKLPAPFATRSAGNGPRGEKPPASHGQPPKLPAPFATRSAGNGPRGEKPPA